jgi:hypothetical protein
MVDNELQQYAFAAPFVVTLDTAFSNQLKLSDIMT